MPVLRTDIERALDEIESQEEGMRFQGLAVVLGKMRWPELIARQRKKDGGLDAYASSTLAKDGIAKGLAASITPTLKKISGDAETALANFSDLKMLLFVTSAKVGNADRRRWEEEILTNHGVELHIIEREEIIALLLVPANASLCASFLHLQVDPEPQLEALVERTKRAAVAVVQTWTRRTAGHPLIELTATRMEVGGQSMDEVWSLTDIERDLSQGRRIVLEGPAGRGKTTSLIQLAERQRSSGIPFMVELPAWTSSRRGILDFIAGMPAFQAEGLTAANLARVNESEPFIFLLNGWNEIGESSSAQADDALRELERDFPSAGIIVATRTHHLVPPLPGAMRLKLLRLRRDQRAAYMAARLGDRAGQLADRIDRDPALDDLTRTPFILAEVASLIEADAEIPSTKVEVIAQVLTVQEQRNEHRNALHGAPIFGRQADYLQALAFDMTSRGAVALSEAEARARTSSVIRSLVADGQIESVGAPAVLASLTAHHALERVDYPRTEYQFGHQQLQEYFAALKLRARLMSLPMADREAVARFVGEYVNNPVWAEPLRMVAETFSERFERGEVSEPQISAGRDLVLMALGVDPVFASELAELCGAAVWSEVREVVGNRLRDLAARGGSYRHYAVAAMLATGSSEFRDVIVPLLSSPDQQSRLETYRLWQRFDVACLGEDWASVIAEWPEDAREDLVGELLQHRADADMVAIAMRDDSQRVKKAAASGLLWNGSGDAVVHLVDSMDSLTFNDFVSSWYRELPAALKERAVTAMRTLFGTIEDPAGRLRTAGILIELGEGDVAEGMKEALSAIPESDIHRLSSHYIRPALIYLGGLDATWTSQWILRQLSCGALFNPDYWLPLASEVTNEYVDKCLTRLETEDMHAQNVEGLGAIIARHAHDRTAARIFASVRNLQLRIDAAPVRPEFEMQVKRQLENVFHMLGADVAVAGVLSCVQAGNADDMRVAADLLSRVARPDRAPLCIENEDLAGQVRLYLKSGVPLILRRDDFTGKEKAHLASAIAQVGTSHEIVDIVSLVRADIARVRVGREARARGERGAAAEGAVMSYAMWNVASLAQLPSEDATEALIALLEEPEYQTEVVNELVREFRAKPARMFSRAPAYSSVWEARERPRGLIGDMARRRRITAALSVELRRAQAHGQGAGLLTLARGLAVVDGRDSAAAVLEQISEPGRWDYHICVDAAESLLMAGVVLPAANFIALVDAFLGQNGRWLQGSEKALLCRMLALCLFSDDPAGGVTKVREVVGTVLLGYELREVIGALGESREGHAVDLLIELASQPGTFDQCYDSFLDAFLASHTDRGNQILLGVVDPDVADTGLRPGRHRESEWIVRLVELGKRNELIGARLRQLCERDLSEVGRYVLSKVMSHFPEPADQAANLLLIDDTKQGVVPSGVWDQLRDAFVEQRPYESVANAFTEHARASNDLRATLFGMATNDARRREGASILLGQIEVWRLEYGRPSDEPRHPDLASGSPWPP